MVRILIAVLCVTGVAAAPPPPLPKTKDGLAKVAITVERTACYGTCPVYRVTVRGDGRVEWHGEEHVAAVGARTRKVAPAEVAVIVRRLDEAGFAGWKTSYEEFKITDQPSQILTVEWAGTKKTIRHYTGDDSAPKALDEVMKLVDEVAKVKEWIGKK